MKVTFKKKKNKGDTKQNWPSWGTAWQGHLQVVPLGSNMPVIIPFITPSRTKDNLLPILKLPPNTLTVCLAFTISMSGLLTLKSVIVFVNFVVCLFGSKYFPMNLFSSIVLSKIQITCHRSARLCYYWKYITCYLLLTLFFLHRMRFSISNCTSRNLPLRRSLRFSSPGYCNNTWSMMVYHLE